MNSFLGFLKQKYPNIAASFSGKSPGTSSFNQMWKRLAADDKQAFGQIQHEFIQSSHYNPVVAKARELGLDVTKRSKALQDVIWSTAVQHGTGGAASVLRNALAGNPGMSDEQLIRRIYAERGANNGMKYFRNSSSNIRNSVLSRFRSEMNDALSML